MSRWRRLFAPRPQPRNAGEQDALTGASEEVTADRRGPSAQPDAYRFAGHLAQRFGCSTIVDVGCRSPERLASLHPQYEVAAIGPPDAMARARQRFPFGTWLGVGEDAPTQLPDPPAPLGLSVIVCANVIERADDPAALLESLRRWMEQAPVLVVTTRDPGSDPSGRWTRSEFEGALAKAGLNVAFVGSAPFDEHDVRKTNLIAVVENASSPRPHDWPPPPADFRVVAIVAAYNEEDIVVPSLARMIDEGLDVYFIDNWSTDSTYELARTFEGRGVIALERFPKDAPSAVGDWHGILERKDEVARDLDANWIVHHDVDEIRVPPWPGATLREALYNVHRAGFNAIDHTVVDFKPIDDGFVAGSDFERYFKYFASSGNPTRKRINAWKNARQNVALAELGGHAVRFDGLRVFPYRFLIKHYPIRSQSHGERKVFAERQVRLSDEQKRLGWHAHDFRIGQGHVFLRRVGDLEIFEQERFNEEYLVERLSGIGWH